MSAFPSTELAARGKSLAAFDGRCIPGAALLLPQIFPVFSVVAPCPRGASPVSVRRQTFTRAARARRPDLRPLDGGRRDALKAVPYVANAIDHQWQPCRGRSSAFAVASADAP